MNLYTIIFFIIFLSACSETPKGIPESAKSEKTDTTNFSDTIRTDSLLKADTIETSGKFEPIKFVDNKEFYHCYTNTTNPSTYLNRTWVYAKPDTLSEIIELLKFNTIVSITEDSECDWFKIKLDNKVGYVRSDQIASHSFNSVGVNKNLKYFIVTDFNSQQLKPNLEAIIYKYDLNSNLCIDTLEIMEFGADIFKQFNTSKWKNVDLLIHTSSSGGCCGCTMRNYYIIDANGKFETIFTTSTLLDDGGEGYQNYTNVTLPDKPETDTIYYHEYEYGGLYHKNGEAVLDKKGNWEKGVIVDITKCYKWDGIKLIELKR